MYLEHASYGYPTHLVPLLDLALTLLLLALILWIRRRSSTDPAWARALWHVARRASTKTPRMLAGLFLLGVLASAAVELVLGPPVPRVVDEFSYLFAAETFARGDLTNPPSPHWRHFDMVHVLPGPPNPTVQSKYPPAQGLVLALGFLLGRPSAALWLMTGGLAAAVAWLLALRLPRPWPLFGALAVLFRVGLGSYWNQSYWGGTVAAVGGILALGGAWSLARSPRPGPAALLGLGLVVLAASRPFEGLLFALPIAVVLACRLATVRGDRGGRLGVVLTLLAVLGVGALALAGYDDAVTGDPLLLPHAAYSDLVGIGDPHFLWQVDGGVGWQRALALGFERTSFVLFFVLGLAGSLLAVLAQPELRSQRGLVLAALAAGATLVGAFLTRPFYVHYAAPLVGVLVMMAMAGLRRLTLTLERDGRAGKLLAPAFVAAQIVLCLVQLPAHRPDADSVAGLRETTHQWLVKEPGRDLVFLCNESMQNEWMANSPDLEGTEVLWARELTDKENDALAAAFPDRRVWHLDYGPDGVVLRRGGYDGPAALELTLSAP